MSDYTPTTKEVRKIYADYRDDIREGDRDPSKSYPLSGHEFDRWLAEVKAEAWDVGYKSAERNMVFSDRYVLDVNPYRGEENSE